MSALLVAELCFNFILLGIDAAWVVWLWQRPGWGTALVVMGVHAAATCLVALVLANESFLFMRLVAWGWFVHFPILAFVAGSLPRRSGWYRALWWLAACTAIGIAVDAFLVEPHDLEVSRREITTAKVDQPFRVVVIADLQTDTFGDYEREVLRTACALQPDLVLCAGDYIQTPEFGQWEQLRDEVRDFLNTIDWHPRMGMFAVGGNSDWHQWPQIFDGTRIEAVEATASRDLESPAVALTCLSMLDSFDTDLRIDARETFHIVLGHAPDFALGQIEADLLIAGHTHGGQVQLPVLGPVLTSSRIPRHWAANLTEIKPGQYLLVSRGIGMERLAAPRLRFLCRPELAILDVKPIQHERQINTMRYARFLAMLVTICLIMGCGQGSYEQLIKQQISEVGTWTSYESPLGYAVRIPDGVDSAPKSSTDSSDLLEFEWKGHRFRVEGLSTNNPDLDAEATKLKDYYVSQSYEASEPRNVNVDKLSGKELTFTKPEADDLQIRIVSFRQGIVSLMVSAPAIQDRIAQQFFGSVRHKPVQRRR